MNKNTNSPMALGNERPWWSVRPALLAALATLVTCLVTLLTRPELLERSFSLAGL